MGVTEGPAGRGVASAGSWRLAAVFGLLSFLQGVIEPCEGLLSQPVRSVLTGWGQGAKEVGWFSAALGLPWALKPVLGLLTDVVPLWGSGFRGYVVAAGGASVVAFLALAAAGVPGPGGAPAALLAGLLVATAAVALADVATDALVVHRGRLDGQTARYQSSQWFFLYASGVVNGAGGGVLTARGETGLALVVCASAAAAMAASAAAVGRGPAPASPAPGPLGARGRRAVSALAAAAREPGVLAVAGFLAVANFSPFNSSALLHLHMTGVLGLGERFFGLTFSVLAVASMAAAVLYGLYARSVPPPARAYAAVALGVVSTAAYALVRDRGSAVAVTVVVGLTSMTATLVQFELAARACPAAAPATVFATLMAVANLSASLATWLGAEGYEAVRAGWGPSAAFLAVTAAASALVAGAGLIVPFLPTGREGRGPAGG